MKKPVLVVMAAGMGSRYGGLKQSYYYGLLYLRCSEGWI